MDAGFSGSICAGLFREMDDEADDETEKGRADPTKPRLGKRQNAAHSVQQAVQMAGRAKRIGQRAQQIVDRGDQVCSR